MSTASPNLFDRMCKAILDQGGTSIYGDERERYHWYEGIAVAASLQWTAIPWALLILAAVDADRFGPALWTLFGVWIVPLLVMNGYAQRHRVSQPDQLDRNVWLNVAAAWLPMIGFLLIMVWPVDDAGWAPLVGGLIGVVVATIGLTVWKQRRR